MATCAIETPWDLTRTRRAYELLARRTALKHVQGKPWTDTELDLVLELVQAYTDVGFSMDAIAAELQCDRSTLFRRVKQARERKKNLSPTPVAAHPVPETTTDRRLVDGDSIELAGIRCASISAQASDQLAAGSSRNCRAIDPIVSYRAR